MLKARVQSSALMRRMLPLAIVASMLAGCDRMFDERGSRALELARMVLRGNAEHLYHFQ